MRVSSDAQERASSRSSDGRAAEHRRYRRWYRYGVVVRTGLVRSMRGMEFRILGPRGERRGSCRSGGRAKAEGLARPAARPARTSRFRATSWSRSSGPAGRRSRPRGSPDVRLPAPAGARSRRDQDRTFRVRTPCRCRFARLIASSNSCERAGRRPRDGERDLAGALALAGTARPSSPTSPGANRRSTGSRSFGSKRSRSASRAISPSVRAPSSSPSSSCSSASIRSGRDSTLQPMLSLYRSGRQAEASRPIAMRGGRVETLGIERRSRSEARARILDQDPALVLTLRSRQTSSGGPSITGRSSSSSDGHASSERSARSSSARRCAS